MEWLNPAGAWAFAGFIPVIALYVLKRRAKRVPVPSLMLWKKTEERTQQNKPFQRLRSQVLLWLQLFMVALFALALMRPVAAGGSQAENVLIFDLSMSMQTKNQSGATRLDEAKERALALLDGMRDGDAVTVLAAGSVFEQPLSRSTDHALAARTIQGLEAGNGTADLQGALSLARAMMRDLPSLAAYVFSDSPIEAGDGVSLVAVGQGMPNVGLLDMSIQPENGTAFVRAVSWGADAEVELECYADGALCDVRTVSLPADESRGVLFSVPQGTQRALARLSNGGALAADDVRFAVSESRRQYTALLVTEGNVFLEQALRLMPELNIVLAAPQDAQAATGCDLYIYDGVLPETLPEIGALWIVDPPEAAAGIRPGKSEDAPVSLRAGAGETAGAICENLLLRDIAVRAYKPLAGGVPVLVTGGDALLSVTGDSRRRVAVLGFDVHDSNLPLKADFPVLTQNLLAWLLPDAAAAVQSAVCGEGVAFTLDARTVSAYVETPSGREAALDGSVLSDTGEAGVYQLWETFEDGRERATAFTLHAPQEESDTRAVAASVQGGGAAGAASGYREWTLWVLLLLFAVTLLEWEVSRRGA